MAAWSLGLALVGCLFITWVLALVFAIQVLVKSSREQRDHGRGLAIGALVVAGVWSWCLACSTASEPTPRAPIRGVTATAASSGDCLDDSVLSGIQGDDEAVATGLVTVVPCERLHDFEVYENHRVKGADFPGADAVERQAAVACAREFKPYVGRAYGPSDLDFWVYYPTKQSWQLLDDHGITCVVGELGKKTAGSLKGSRR